MTYEIDLTLAARADIVDALSWSLENFGESVRDGYKALIFARLDAIGGNPTLPGTRDRSDLAADLRTVHLKTCRNEVSPTFRRIANPRHFVAYRQVGEVIQVVRLLHDAMDISAQRIPD